MIFCYRDMLLFSAITHDISKCDYRNRLNQNKLEHNQGKASTRLLIECGIDKKEFAFGLKLIENHHRRVQSDDILKKADIISASDRLYGGNENRFRYYFKTISERIEDELRTIFLDVEYNHEKAKRVIENSIWLDIIPSDVACSLESQSLKTHLIETEYYANQLYKDPCLLDIINSKLEKGEDIFSEGIIKKPRVKPTNRKKTFEYLEKI